MIFIILFFGLKVEKVESFSVLVAEISSQVPVRGMEGFCLGAVSQEVMRTRAKRRKKNRVDFIIFD